MLEIRDGTIFNFYPGLPHMQIPWSTCTYMCVAVPDRIECYCVVYLTASPSFGVHTCTCFKGRIYEASVSLTLSGGYKHYARVELSDLLRKTIVDLHVVSHPDSPKMIYCLGGS